MITKEIVMACRDGGDELMVEHLRAEQRKLNDRLNLVESVLCSIFTRVERGGGYVCDIVMDVWTPGCGFQLNEVEGWWKEHKAKDAIRRKREAEEAKKKAEESK